MKTSKLYNPCTECGEKEAMWHLRARTKFVCEECRKKIEYDQVEKED